MAILASVLVLLAAAVAASSFAAASGARAELARVLAALAHAESRPPQARPPRLVESRRERYGLVWYPTLTVDDGARMVVAATAGLPHCARCVQPLVLTSATPEEWSCERCAEKLPGTAVDIQVLDHVVREALTEFLARRPGYRPAPALSHCVRPDAAAA